MGKVDGFVTDSTHIRLRSRKKYKNLKFQLCLALSIAVVLTLIYRGLSVFQNKVAVSEAIDRTDSVVQESTSIETETSRDRAVEYTARYYGVSVKIVTALLMRPGNLRYPNNVLGLSPQYVDYFVERFSLSKADLESPETNLQAGIGYLVDLSKEYPTMREAMSAWVYGPTAYRNGKRTQNIETYFDSVWKEIVAEESEP